MKTRIKDQTIRFRLSIEELNNLSKGQSCMMTTAIGDHPLIFSLVSSGEIPTAQYADGIYRFEFPEAQFKSLESSDDEGFNHQFLFDQNELLVSVEKDYACVGRSEKQNKGLFPNPNESTC